MTHILNFSQNIKNGSLDQVIEWFRGRGSVNQYIDERRSSITFHNGRISILVDLFKMTALHYAALYGKADIITYLLDKGAGIQLSS